jgi:hypothetical protein
VSELRNANKTVEGLRSVMMIAGSMGAFVASWQIILGHYYFVLFLSLSSYVYGECWISRRSTLGIENDPWKYFFNEKINIVFHAVIAILGFVLAIYELLNY